MCGNPERMKDPSSVGDKEAARWLSHSCRLWKIVPAHSACLHWRSKVQLKIMFHWQKWSFSLSEPHILHYSLTPREMDRRAGFVLQVFQVKLMARKRSSVIEKSDRNNASYLKYRLSQKAKVRENDVAQRKPFHMADASGNNCLNARTHGMNSLVCVSKNASMRTPHLFLLLRWKQHVSFLCSCATKLPFGQGARWSKMKALDHHSHTCILISCEMFVALAQSAMKPWTRCFFASNISVLFRITGDV